MRFKGSADRGAAAVEMALILPVFVMLTFGMITGGLSYAHKISLTQAAREGARYGATLPIPPAAGQTVNNWLTMVKDATVQAAGDDFTPGQNSSAMCVAFINGRDATQDKFILIDATGTVTAPATGYCWDDTASMATDNRVQVQIERDGELNIGIKAWKPHMVTRSVIHFERTVS